MPEYYFKWEDDGNAALSELICDCGYEMDLPPEFTEDGDILTCSECGAQYEAVWEGMKLERINNE